MRVLSIVSIALLSMSVYTGQAQDNNSLAKHFDQLMYGEQSSTKAVSVRGHSHNDYERDIPFWRAYHAGMESIEVDLFVRKDSLYAAHDPSQIEVGKTLEQLYLKPLAKLFKSHGNHAFANPDKKLQLMLDLKDSYTLIMPHLVKLLDAYKTMLYSQDNKDGIKVVLSGSTPAPALFDNYPDYIFYDGRLDIPYTKAQLQRVALISADLHSFTHWNGKGSPARKEMAMIEAAAQQAAAYGKPFRLWGTPESPNTWIILEKLGVTWLNTDKPDVLQEYLHNLPLTRFQQEVPQEVYSPSYASDGTQGAIRNVILLIGDGMGLGHIQAALIANKGSLNMAQMRYIGFSQTASLSPGNTDSGAGGSAIATGQKTWNGVVNVDAEGRPLKNLSDYMMQRGMVTGIISSGDASDATPAVFYGANKDRNDSESISNDLLHNNAVHILIGGRPGPYADAAKYKTFAAAMKTKGFEITNDLNSLESSKSLKSVVYLPQEEVRPVKDGRGDMLSTALKYSIAKLDHNKKGFFIMAEGAQIDYGGHARDLNYVTTETLDFDKAVGEALRFADQDKHTLVIVTADHETGALTLLDADSKNGYLQGHFASNDHSSMMVPVMAYGPGAQNFVGFYQNTDIFHKIMALLNLK